MDRKLTGLVHSGMPAQAYHSLHRSLLYLRRVHFTPPPWPVSVLIDKCRSHNCETSLIAPLHVGHLPIPHRPLRLPPLPNISHLSISSTGAHLSFCALCIFFFRCPVYLKIFGLLTPLCQKAVEHSFFNSLIALSNLSNLEA